MDKYYHYQDGEIYLRLDKKKELKTIKDKETSEKIPKLPIRFIDSVQDDFWAPGFNALLGLAPNGTFFKYIKETYDENEKFSMAFKHIAYDKTKISKDLVVTTYPYINPVPEKHYSKKDVVGTFPVDKDSQFWYFNGSLELEGYDDISFQNKKICMDTLLPDMFGIVISRVWCQRIKEKVCNLEKNPKCLREHADESKIPSIKLTIEDKEYEIKGREYVYFTKNGLQCRLGISYQARSQGSCGADTEVTVGKLFFEKFTPILEYDGLIDEFKLTLTQKFRISGEQKVVWLVLGIIAAILAVLALIWVVLKKRKASPNSDVYVLQQENEA